MGLPIAQELWNVNSALSNGRAAYSATTPSIAERLAFSPNSRAITGSTAMVSPVLAMGNTPSYMKDANGNILYDADGKPVVDNNSSWFENAIDWIDDNKLMSALIAYGAYKGIRGGYKKTFKEPEKPTEYTVKEGENTVTKTAPKGTRPEKPVYDEAAWLPDEEAARLNLVRQPEPIRPVEPTPE